MRTPDHASGAVAARKRATRPSRVRGVLLSLILLATVTAGLDLTPAEAQTVTFTQITSTSGGGSGASSISADGTRIAFVSSGMQNSLPAGIEKSLPPSS